MRFLKNSPVNKPRTIKFLEHSLSFARRDDFLHSLKEIFIEDIYYQRLGANPFIIDCGANIGLSVIYLKRLFPEARIIAFEPDEENFRLLKKNIESFGFDNVEINKEAIWIEDTQLNFSNTGTLGSKVEDTANNSSQLVKARRLKDMLQQRVDFLKLDIEGAEYAVLKDAGENLRNAENIFIEYHGTFEQTRELTEIFELLTKTGFQYYIKEAAHIHPTPFLRGKVKPFDVQLNIFCFKPIIG